METEFNKNLAERLKIARTAAGYKSSRAFANEHAFPEVSYLLHETNKRKMTAESIVEYSAALKVNCSWLLTGQGFPSELKDRNEAIIQYININHSSISQGISTPNINKDDICAVDIELLDKILCKVLDVFTKNEININCNDLLDFSYKLYNNVITTLDPVSRQKMIDIAAESLISANNYSGKKPETIVK